LEMLYTRGFGDMAAYVRARPFVEARPGTIYNYSSGNLSVALAMLERSYAAAGDEAGYDRAPWDLLFDPIGIDTASFEQDGAGVFVGSSYVFMSTEDMAK